MSLQKIWDEVKGISMKVDNLTTDVETLKEKDRVREEREHEGDDRRS